jgi:metal-responsive CopG/Arc/MetJ family transcriptional regulator
MTRKGKDTEIISISLPESTASEMDRLVTDMGYPSRSDLVRDAVRGLIQSRMELANLEGTVEGVMILLYDHKASRDVSDIRHTNMDLIKSFMHTDFAGHSCSVHEGTCKCCEVLMFSGEADDVRRLHNAFRTTKHVEESLVFLA